MKKIIILLASLMLTLSTTVHSFEKSIAFYVGHNNGGQQAAFQTIVSQELVKKGWDVDFKIIGNCGQVKSLMEQSNKPVLAGWTPDWNSSSKNVCYNPPKVKNFVTIYLNTPRLLCGPEGDANFNLIQGKEYRIGVNQGQNHQVLLNDLGKKLGVQFKVIEYKNSGFIKRAMQAQEIDAFYTTAGLVNHETGKQKCLYGTLTEQYAGITPLKDVLKTPNVYTSGAGFFITNKNLKGDLKDALEKDIVSIINTSEYQTALKSGGAFIPGKNKKEQMKYVEDTAKAFTK